MNSSIRYVSTGHRTATLWQYRPYARTVPTIHWDSTAKSIAPYAPYTLGQYPRLYSSIHWGSTGDCIALYAGAVMDIA
eukprot:3940808-Rhodomonas_salina.8